MAHLRGEGLGDLHGAHVRAVLEHAGEGELLILVVAGVLDPVPVEPHLVGDLVLGLGGDRALLERGGEGEQLARRAGLEDVGDRAVAAVLLLGGAGIVRIVGGVLREREHLPGLGVVDHGAAAGRAPLLDRSGDDLLRFPLQVAVDRQDDVAAVLGGDRLLLAGGDDLSLGAALVGGLAGGAPQLVVEGELGASQGGAVGADEAQDVPGHGAGRVDAIGHGVRADARDPQGHRGVPHLGLDVLAQVGEAGIAGEGLLGAGDGPAEHGSELRRRGLDPRDLGGLRVLEVLVHLHLVDPQVVALDRAGQHRPVAIGDLSAQRGDGAGDGALGDGVLGAGARVQSLHPDEASRQQQHAHHDQADDEAVALGGLPQPGPRDPRTHRTA